jgi:opacity protein-like surface antigen
MTRKHSKTLLAAVFATLLFAFPAAAVADSPPAPDIISPANGATYSGFGDFSYEVQGVEGEFKFTLEGPGGFCETDWRGSFHPAVYWNPWDYDESTCDNTAEGVYTLSAKQRDWTTQEEGDWSTVEFTIGTSSEELPEDDPASEEAYTEDIYASHGENSGGTTTQAAGLIRCRVSIDYPHKSSHQPNRANVESHISCTHPVSSLRLDTKLWRAGYVVGVGTRILYGTFFITGQANARCVTGNYMGTATGTVVFPPGYVPATATATVGSPVRHINC